MCRYHCWFDLGRVKLICGFSLFVIIWIHILICLFITHVSRFENFKITFYRLWWSGPWVAPSIYIAYFTFYKNMLIYEHVNSLIDQLFHPFQISPSDFWCYRCDTMKFILTILFMVSWCYEYDFTRFLGNISCFTV